MAEEKVLPSIEFLDELVKIQTDIMMDPDLDQSEPMTYTKLIQGIIGMGWHAEEQTGLFREDLSPDDVKSVLLQVASYLLTP